MEALLNKGIKEIIDQYPDVEKILDEYGIGCGPCSVGICELKDIVDIHNLPADQEQELMRKIADIIYPAQDIKIPPGKKKTPAVAGEIKYSPPIKQLVDEHVLIKRWVALIPAVVNNLDLESDPGRQLILDGIDMIRSYADRYHHAKEEDEILYPWMDRNLSTTQVGELFKKFSAVDEKTGFSPNKYIKFIEKLEKQFREK